MITDTSAFNDEDWKTFPGFKRHHRCMNEESRSMAANFEELYKTLDLKARFEQLMKPQTSESVQPES